MRNSTDTRIAIVMAGRPAPGDMVLIEAGLPGPPGAARFTASTHPIGCLCCLPRSGAGEALARLYRARAMGEVPLFTTLSVIATAAGEAAIRHAVQTEILCQARYRLDE